jgi:hypothetical protein
MKIDNDSLDLDQPTVTGSLHEHMFFCTVVGDIITNFLAIHQGQVSDYAFMLVAVVGIELKTF